MKAAQNEEDRCHLIKLFFHNHICTQLLINHILLYCFTCLINTISWIKLYPPLKVRYISTFFLLGIWSHRLKNYFGDFISTADNSLTIIPEQYLFNPFFIIRTKSLDKIEGLLIYVRINECTENGTWIVSYITCLLLLHFPTR